MTDASPLPTDPDEPRAGSLAGRLNWLRAGVLGANGGIVSSGMSLDRCTLIR